MKTERQGGGGRSLARNQSTLFSDLRVKIVSRRIGLDLGGRRERSEGVSGGHMAARYEGTRDGSCDKIVRQHKETQMLSQLDELCSKNSHPPEK